MTIPQFAPIEHPSAWRAPNVDSAWKWRFTEEDLQEIDAAIKHCKAQPGLQRNKGIPTNITKEMFPLPNLSKKLMKMHDDLENGMGVSLIRGFPVDKYPEEDLAVMYLGVFSYLGRYTPISQVALSGEFIGHGLPFGKVVAVTDKMTPTQLMSSHGFALHTDRCDVVALLCVRKASSGGISRIVSATTVYNELLKRCPQHLPTLFGNYPFHWEGRNNWHEMPIMAFCPDGKFTTYLTPTYIEQSQFVPGAPKITQAQIEALEALLEVGADPDIAFEFLLEPGDCYVANNHVIYHGRAAHAFLGEDLEVAEGRLMYRLWVNTTNSRQLPDTPEMRTLWGNLMPGEERGGLFAALKSNNGVYLRSPDVARAVETGEFSYHKLFKPTISKHIHTVK